MKNKLVPIVLSSLAISAFMGLSLLTFVNEDAMVDAGSHVQRIDNFDPYTYSGDYYDFVESDEEGTSGGLRKNLTDNILPKSWPTYSGSGTNTLSDLCQQADEDPLNTSNMIYLYTRESRVKAAANVSTTWNREHVWPRSLSGNHWSSSHNGSDYAGTDLLHLRPVYETTNSARGSIKYGYAGSGKTTNNYDGMVYSYTGNGYFEPLDSVKGDVARICMYLYVAYYDFYKDLDGTSMPEITNVFESYDTLIEWHTLDKPDAMEGHRNDFAESSLQENRNPFVDHPEYAWKIFSNKASESVIDACRNAYPIGAPVTPTLLSVTLDHTLNKLEYYQNDDIDTAGLVLTAHYDIGGDKDVTSQATYSFTNVGSDVGYKTLTVSVLGYNFDIEINVNEIPDETIHLESIEAEPELFDLKIGETGHITYTINPNNAYPTPTVNYSIDNADIASISDDGVVTALIEGEATITVSAMQNAIIRTDTITVHVTKADEPVDPIGPDDPVDPSKETTDIQKYIIIGAIVGASALILSLVMLTLVLILMIAHRIAIR